MSNFDLVLTLFLQITVILAACRIVGTFVGHLGQTQVVGEMIAGVMLGPSLLGTLAPVIQHRLFPQQAVIAVGAPGHDGARRRHR